MSGGIILPYTPPGRGDDERLVWEDLFPRRAPVEIEVGSGKGRYLLRAALERPQHDFLGIERRVATLGLCASRAEAMGLDNVLLLRADATRVFWSRIAAGSVRIVHVYYPDPWWKLRHRKRRLFTPDFVADVARTLSDGGELRVATDVTDYFEVIVATIAASGLFERAEAMAEEFGTPEEPLTSYQAKYARLGRGINAALYRRNGRPAPATIDPRSRLRLLKERRREERMGKEPDPPEGAERPGRENSRRLRPE